MKELDYGKGYRYAHDEATPSPTCRACRRRSKDRKYYEPTERGFEKGDQTAPRRLGRDQEAATNRRIAYRPRG